MAQFEPLAVDRQIRETAEAWRRWRRGLSAGEAHLDDPFVRAPRASGRTLFLELSELPPEDPARTAMRRWVYRLAEQRINLPWLVRVHVLRNLERHPLQEPEPGQFTLAQTLQQALSEPSRRREWLSAFLQRDESLGVATTTLWQRRQEIAVRMGLPSPNGIELPNPDLAAHANRWLLRSDDAAEALQRRELADWVSLALGSEAQTGWPGHLSPASLQELLREGDLLRGVPLDPGRLPEPLGASSFLRALARVGAAWCDALGPTHQPFVIAHDPYGLSRRVHGALFALLPLESAFARRRLGIGPSRVSAHQRVLRRVVLLESRVAALRVLLRGPALGAGAALAESFEALSQRATGVAWRRPHPGTIWRLHVDDGQRFAGLLLAAQRAERLREEHDEDWFRNPRAIDQLRSEAELSPETTVDTNSLVEATATLERRLLVD